MSITMTLLHVLAFGLPWLLIMVWLCKWTFQQVNRYRSEEAFYQSWEASEHLSKHYRKKYKNVEVGEHDGR